MRARPTVPAVLLQATTKPSPSASWEDVVDSGMETQLWIVLEYCKLGSLYDVLVGQTLDEATVFV